VLYLVLQVCCLSLTRL
jgi:hypothetical protein